MQRDSRLIIKQVNREFGLQKIALVTYRIVVQKLIKPFLSIQDDHVSRVHKKGWCTTQPGSKVDISNEAVYITLMEKTL